MRTALAALPLGAVLIPATATPATATPATATPATAAPTAATPATAAPTAAAPHEVNQGYSIPVGAVTDLGALPVLGSLGLDFARLLGQ
ncbi:hypothetical protein ACIOJE_25825 [Kitasatospora sp. NPDC087861]|uniref:hypothetical protein n=1 Tax=Kitasatospora sp. NPDC087861 TaxID=3364070 RepID=UPI0037F89A81